MGTQLNFLRKWFKSAYTAELEAQRDRLLDENRQLVNSCLANAGMQQIERAVQNKTPQPIKGRLLPSQLRRKFEQIDRDKVVADKEKALGN